MNDEQRMINEMRDYPPTKHDDQMDAHLIATRAVIKKWRPIRTLLRVANWLLTTAFLTAVPYVIGYVGMRLIRFMVAPPTTTTNLEWGLGIWSLGFVGLAALVIGIMGAYVLIDTTRKM